MDFCRLFTLHTEYGILTDTTDFFWMTTEKKFMSAIVPLLRFNFAAIHPHVRLKTQTLPNSKNLPHIINARLVRLHMKISHIVQD